MNHYLAAAVRSNKTPLTVTLVNYADGSPVIEDARFLSQNYSPTLQNLFRLLTILSTPRNQFDYEYKGEADKLHHFEVTHQNSYSVLDQFVVDGSVFHVKQVDQQNIRAVRCSGTTAIPASGKLQSMVLPLKHLEMYNNRIVFEFHGIWFRIDASGVVTLYTTELQCKTMPQMYPWQANTNCVTFRQNSFAVVFGENDFGIIGNGTNNGNISNFFYARNDSRGIVVLTAANACIVKNGMVEMFFSISSLAQYRIDIMTVSTTIDRFMKAPILLRGAQNTTIQTSLIWGLHNTNISDIVLSKDKDAVCTPINGNVVVAFAIGENR